MATEALGTGTGPEAVNEAARQQLAGLRRRQPAIGLRQAQQLLTSTAGDVDAAVRRFEEHAVATVAQRAGVDTVTAAGHLQRVGYDIHAALTSIEATQTTLTERMLRRYRNQPEEALMHLSTALEYAYGLKHAFWLELAELQRLNSAQYCFMLLHEWLSYEGWENFSTAVYRHPDEVDTQLRQPLHLPEIADCLQAYRRRQDRLIQQYAARPDQQLWAAIRHDSLLRQYEQQFQQLRPVLIERLLAYVRQHISQFP